ncbi:MAG: hypothetical protein LBE31_08000, partial [Deltaproteobacteria bacterium]|nr:hypothetical protein [Deltaproteobacteria bacterium]
MSDIPLAKSNKYNFLNLLSSHNYPVGLRTGFLISAIGGLAQALAWPKANLWFLTYICLICLWLAITGQKPKRAFLF